MQDVVDLRSANWVSKNGDKGPKTLTEIREEVCQSISFLDLYTNINRPPALSKKLKWSVSANKPAEAVAVCPWAAATHATSPATTATKHHPQTLPEAKSAATICVVSRHRVPSTSQPRLDRPACSARAAAVVARILALAAIWFVVAKTAAPAAALVRLQLERRKRKRPSPPLTHSGTPSPFTYCKYKY